MIETWKFSIKPKKSGFWPLPALMTHWKSWLNTLRISSQRSEGGNLETDVAIMRAKRIEATRQLRDTARRLQQASHDLAIETYQDGLANLLDDDDTRS